MTLTNIALAIAIVASTLLVGCETSHTGSPTLPAGSSPRGEEIEPLAGHWKTWVLTSGSQLRLPPPPDQAAAAAELKELHALTARRDPAALDRIVFWDTGAPGYRWNGILADELSRHNLAGATTSRHVALMEVAIYDATIATWNSKYAHRRPRPGAVDPTLATALATPRSPSYPSEHAAVAAAAARVLAYLFPDDSQALMAKAMEAAGSRELAGLQYPSDTAAGLDLGGKVADLVIERARHDGSEVSWSGSVPTEPGKWTTARYPSGAAPLGPLFGSYRTWVLASGHELRPGPPPAFDSAEKAAELAEVVKFARTFPTSAAAFYWQTPKGTTTHWMLAADQKIFEYRLDANPPRAARVQALVGIATYDAAVACWDAKYTYWAMRPFHYDPQFTPMIPVPAHPSYPAAHGCHSGAAGAVLAYLFPRDAASLTAQADEAGMSRLWGGIHFPSDIRVGLALGRVVAQRVVERAQADGSR
ncbi:MAG TPA: phosphatase PAP2 family protein [Methylomirabilota bacterium]|nr:phosphatase PAP2 family protein [Methylomirabilota bacterium]